MTYKRSSPTYVHEFERAKGKDEIREKLAAGTSIRLA
jgi:hypothetical protein